MKIDKMKKEDLELLSYKEITSLILEEKGAMNTLELFTKIVELLELPKSTIEKKIGDYYTTLTTDKNFLLLDDGKWDLRKNHTSDKIVKAQEQEDEEDEEDEEDVDNKVDLIEDEEDFDNQISDEDEFDDGDDDLKDLVVLDEEDLELEQ